MCHVVQKRINVLIKKIFGANEIKEDFYIRDRNFIRENRSDVDFGKMARTEFKKLYIIGDLARRNHSVF